MCPRLSLSSSFPLILVVIALGWTAGCFLGDGEPKEAKKAQGYLPSDNTIPGLARIGKPRQYRGLGEMKHYLGQRASHFHQYGAVAVSAADYRLGENETLSIETFEMKSEEAAAGLFHYYRGTRLNKWGIPVDVGAGGVVDKLRKKRNLYFYKGSYFVAIFYTGKGEAPDLLPLARTIAEKIPGTSAEARGFEYLDVEGVQASTASISPGYLFNCEFLPIGVLAKAPGAGDVAEVFLLAHRRREDAEKTAQDYQDFLEAAGKDYTIKHVKALTDPSHRPRPVWWARDPKQGRVICTRYDTWVIGVVRPETYEKGEEILTRVVEKIQSSAPSSSSAKNQKKKAKAKATAEER